MKTLSLSVLTIALLATITGCCNGGGKSCNGDANTNIATSTNNSTTSPSYPKPSINQVGNYRLDPTPKNQDAYIKQINHFAKQGYALVNPTTEGLLSYQPSYSINIEYIADNQTMTLNKLNDMGQKGYLYKMSNYDSSYKLFNIYFKNKDKQKTYQYQMIKASEPFLTKTNEVARNGWRYHSMQVINAISYYLYVNDNSKTNYEYVVENQPNNIDKFREQINRQARNGGIYRGGLFLDNKLVSVFERSNDSKSLDCQVIDTSIEVDLTMMNDHAKQGYISLGKLIIGNQSVEVFCKGINNVWQPLTGAMLP